MAKVQRMVCDACGANWFVTEVLLETKKCPSCSGKLAQKQCEKDEAGVVHVPVR